LKEQLRIVDEVERLLTRATAVESAMKADHVRVKGLRKSILKWAFEGRLVDQDPSDEPASVLLDRIRAERQTAGTTRKPRSRRKKTEATPA
jgi:type I restriction enzyme S subunit